MKKVAVIGAGVCGLGAAIRIKEAFPFLEVVIVTKDVTPNTTGDGSAGLWGPYILGKTPESKIVQWSAETHKLFLGLWQRGEAGACLIPMFRMDKNATTKPCWKDIVFGFHEFDQADLKRWNEIFSSEYKYGSSFTSLTCEPRILLPYLMDRFIKAGGKVEISEVKSLQEFAKGDYDIIINCTGLGAKDIVPDKKVFPIRGQVARVHAPWMYHVLLDDSDDGNYIIPNMNNVVLGGTHQEGDSNLSLCPKDGKFIFDGCHRLVPGLKNAETLFEWVGLRPGRESVRLEREDIKVRRSGTEENVVVIHNYGHGGSGVTLFWGCADEVVQLLSDAINVNIRCRL